MDSGVADPVCGASVVGESPEPASLRPSVVAGLPPSSPPLSVFPPPVVAPFPSTTGAEPVPAPSGATPVGPSGAGSGLVEGAGTTGVVGGATAPVPGPDDPRPESTGGTRTGVDPAPDPPSRRGVGVERSACRRVLLVSSAVEERVEERADVLVDAGASESSDVSAAEPSPSSLAVDVAAGSTATAGEPGNPASARATIPAPEAGDPPVRSFIAASTGEPAARSAANACPTGAAVAARDSGLGGSGTTEPPKPRSPSSPGSGPNATPPTTFVPSTAATARTVPAVTAARCAGPRVGDDVPGPRDHRAILGVGGAALPAQEGTDGHRPVRWDGWSRDGQVVGTVLPGSVG